MKQKESIFIIISSHGMILLSSCSYFRFSNEVRDQVRADLEAKGEKYNIKAAAPLTKAKWEALGEEGQKPYHDAYAVAKAKYEEDMKAWKQTDAGKQYAKAKSTAAKRKQQNSKVPKAKRAKKDAAPAAKQESEGEEEADESVELSPEETGEEEESPEEE